LNVQLSWAIRTGQAIRLSAFSHADLYHELRRLRASLHINLDEVPDRELYRELGRRRQTTRKVHRGGPGRPRKPRCACGRFNLDAARRKAHVWRRCFDWGA
jgi:hypothetical protein